MRRLGNGWIEFEAYAMSEDVTRVRAPTSSIRCIRSLYSDGSLVPGGSVHLVGEGDDFYTLQTSEEIDRLLELVTDPDFRSMSDVDLQVELEMAERRHTRALAEVARRSP